MLLLTKRIKLVNNGQQNAEIGIVSDNTEDGI
jgi:hypothetical protein